MRSSEAVKVYFPTGLALDMVVWVVSWGYAWQFVWREGRVVAMRRIPLP